MILNREAGTPSDGQESFNVLRWLFQELQLILAQIVVGHHWKKHVCEWPAVASLHVRINVASRPPVQLRWQQALGEET